MCTVLLPPCGNPIAVDKYIISYHIISYQGKGKGHPITGHEGPQVEYRYSSTLSLTSAPYGVGGQRHASAALPPRKNRYPLYRRLGGPQDRSGQVRKISPLPGLDPRTVQPVASRYTDWAIPAHVVLMVHTLFTNMAVGRMIQPGGPARFPKASGWISMA